MKTPWLWFCTALLLCAGGAAAQTGQGAQTSQPPQKPAKQKAAEPAPSAQGNGRVVEEIIARVNNEIITRSELQRAESTLRDEVKQDCPNCTAEQLAASYEERKKNELRDLIDQSLLVQRAKDEGISVETEVIKQLDQIRQQNKFATMEDLQKAIEAEGMNFEDYKANIRNGMLTQTLIRRDVGQRIIVDKQDVAKYYEEHKSGFNRPEQVYLREIFVSTEGKKPEEIPALEKKANDLLQRVKNGEDFGQLAQHYSDGTTAKQGGSLGAFERGQLAKEIADVVFALNRNDLTPVIRTKQGFEVLQVEEHYQAGEQPLTKVEDEITNRLVMEKMQPALREYLKTLREESYVVVKAGYVDTAGISSSPIPEVPATPDDAKDKKEKKLKKKRRAA